MSASKNSALTGLTNLGETAQILVKILRRHGLLIGLVLDGKNSINSNIIKHNNKRENETKPTNKANLLQYQTNKQNDNNRILQNKT